LLAAILKIKMTLNAIFIIENWYLGLFWSEELIGNDENCIQGHFYDATVSKMADNKIVKLSMVSDFQVWLCLDANTEVPKRSPNQNSGHQPIPHFKILLDINFHWHRRPNWLVMMKIAFRVIFMMSPFPQWPPTKLTNC
jgi:hypothetical protein